MLKGMMKNFKWISGKQLLAVFTAVVVLSTLLYAHRWLAIQGDADVIALRATERILLRSRHAPTLLEHFGAGAAYTWFWFCVVQLVGNCYRDSKPMTRSESWATRTAILGVAAFIEYLVLGPDTRFSPVIYLVAVLMAGGPLRSFCAPRKHSCASWSGLLEQCSSGH